MCDSWQPVILARATVLSGAIRQSINAAGLSDRFEYRGELSRDEKIEFLQSLDVFSVRPITVRVRALDSRSACQRRAGRAAGAWQLCRDGHRLRRRRVVRTEQHRRARRAELRQLALNPAQAATLGERGRAAVVARYNDTAMAQQTLDVYRRLLDE